MEEEGEVKGGGGEEEGEVKRRERWKRRGRRGGEEKGRWKRRGGVIITFLDLQCVCVT